MIKNFIRTDNQFSLCGLNCSLCPMQIRGECPGCFKESFCAQMCTIAPCSVKHGNIQYCFECEEYPCEKYDGIDKYDSLISHKNQKKDLAKAKQIGIDKYLAEQTEKKRILNHLLSKYDDGHREVFFCLAVNLMKIDDLNFVMKEADRETSALTIDKKSDYIKQKLLFAAEKKGINLLLRRAQPDDFS